MKINFSSPKLPTAGAVVVGVLDEKKLTATGERLEKATGGAITRAIGATRFKGTKGQVLTILAPAGLKASRVVLIGLGKAGEIDDSVAQAVGGAIANELGGSGETAAAVAVDAIEDAKLGASAFAAQLALGAKLRSYRFDKYRTKEMAEEKPSLKTLTVMTRNAEAAKKLFTPLDKVADGVFFTRDLVSEPANVIFPASLADQIQLLTKLGVAVEVLEPRQMRRLNMGALLGVAQGSANEPRLVVMSWRGAKGAKDQYPIAFVGKGVTFDAGGISIKPAGGMEDMKWDMGGAGVVIGLLKALAGRKAKINAIGIVGLVENMPSANAQRPGDVVTTMSGQTIEVINTDAEGRLVLADALWYCQETFKPKTVIDLATLTGAIITSLGHEQAGLFANDDELADRLIAAGKAVNEKLWRMPLGESYDRDIKSEIADMKNVGSGRGAGSITAAQLLQRFIKKDVAWAHLDIAGVTWAKTASAVTPKGGSGFGVRLLDRLVADHYE